MRHVAFTTFFDYDQLEDVFRRKELDHGVYDAEEAARWVREDMEAEDPFIVEKHMAQEAFADAARRAKADFAAKTSLDTLLSFAKLSYSDLVDVANFKDLSNTAKCTLKVFSEVCQRASLRPLTAAKALDTQGGRFEVMSAIVDS